MIFMGTISLTIFCRAAVRLVYAAPIHLKIEYSGESFYLSRRDPLKYVLYDLRDMVLCFRFNSFCFPGTVIKSWSDIP